jgi:hypothetical protein
MTNTISLTEAVDMLFHGKCNVPTAAKAAGAEPEVLKRLLLEKVRSKPEMSPLQLSLPVV